MRHGIITVVLLASAFGCKGGAKKEGAATPGGDKAPAEAAGEEPAKQEPALPSIGDDPSPVKICARLAAAAAAEGGEGEKKWKELAPDCEKSLAEAAASRTEKYNAFAECMRDKTTFTAVMNDCKQLEGDPPGPTSPE